MKTINTETVPFFTSRVALAALLTLGVLVPMPLLAKNKISCSYSHRKFRVGRCDRDAIANRDYAQYQDQIIEAKLKAAQDGRVYKEPTMISWDERGFAYVGVCEAIWYPETPDKDKKFLGDWPAFCESLKEQGIDVPDLALAPAPWHSQEELNADLENLNKSDEEIADPDQINRKHQLSELVNFLKREDVIKSEYGSRVDRLEKAIDPNSESSILKDLPPGKAEIIKANFNLVAHIKPDARRPVGLYALVDYCNFKGEGTAPAERYNTEPWGLGEVLFLMNDLRSDEKTLNDYVAALRLGDVDTTKISDMELFVIAAAKALDNRIENNKIERTRIKDTPAYVQFIARYGDENTTLTDAEEAARDQAFLNEFGLPYHDNSQYRSTIFYPHLVDYLYWPQLPQLFNY
jgi:hypothetical protein